MQPWCKGSSSGAARGRDPARADKRPRGGGAHAHGLNGTIDMIVPRGGKSLVARVQPKRAFPCSPISKASATPMCTKGRSRHGARIGAERQDAAHRRLWRDGNRADRQKHFGHASETILDDLAKAGCEIRGDDAVRAAYPAARMATEEDWRTEYLDAIIAVRTVAAWKTRSVTSAIMARSTPTPSSPKTQAPRSDSSLRSIRRL